MILTPVLYARYPNAPTPTKTHFPPAYVHTLISVEGPHRNRNAMLRNKNQANKTKPSHVTETADALVLYVDRGTHVLSRNKQISD